MNAAGREEMLFCIARDREELEMSESDIDGIEIRFDCFDQIDLAEIQEFFKRKTLPVIVTLRKQSHGGFFRGSEEERLSLLEKLFLLRPEFVDLEHDTDQDFIYRMSKLHPDVKIIGSYHNFEKTPHDLENILAQMEPSIFYACKIATKARSTLDAMKMMLFVKKQSGLGKKIIGICMGEKGALTRVLGPIYGSLIGYARQGVHSSTGEGQLSVRDLMEVYHFRSLSPSTSVYGLIGNPVTKSIGHFVHNKVMGSLGIDGVYIKLHLDEGELQEFSFLAKQLRFHGLSVTMPFKEKIISFLDGMDDEARKTGSVNTVLFEKGRSIGFNTDGRGAIDALEKYEGIAGKKMAILGSGGTARSIAREAMQRGAFVTILGRDGEKTQKIAQELGAKGSSLAQIEEECNEGYDILVNATPVPIPVQSKYIPNGVTVLDVDIKAIQQEAITILRSSGHRVICGHEMFINQAIAQWEIWSKGEMSKEIISKIISSEVLLRI